MKKAWSVTQFIVITVAAAFVVVAAIVPLAFSRGQHSGMPIYTQSMEKTIYAGDLIALTESTCGNTNIGDIVTYEPNPGDDTFLITHRVVTKNVGGPNGCTFTVKGDNNTLPDRQKVMRDMIVGKVASINGHPYVIPKAGYVTNFIQKNLYLSIAILAAIIGLSFLIDWLVERGDKRDMVDGEPATVDSTDEPTGDTVPTIEENAPHNSKENDLNA